MENKTRSRVMLAITLFSAIVLSGTVFVCARRAGEEVTQRSFDELTTATKELAKDINNATRTDQTILSAMAELIAGQDEDDLDSVLRIMNTFSLDKTFVSTVALLRPDGTLLLTDGARYDVSGAFDFETEAARGAYISDRVTSYFAPEKLVVRNVAPVKRDGETIAILYGMVPLQELSRSYRPTFTAATPSSSSWMEIPATSCWIPGMTRSATSRICVAAKCSRATPTRRR